jgi:hypothetical protein
MRALAVLMTMALLGGCENDAERRRAMAADENAELLRITDPAHGADELRKRILQNLKLSSPYLAIWVDDMEARAIPVSTPWTVRCDGYAGVSIAFTTNLTDLSGGLVMRLSETRPTKAQCLDIAISTAKVLDAIVVGR